MTTPVEIRKLAAVMFTDLEGYTSMFQNNETNALEKIHTHRQYLDQITSKHHGRIIQFYGDGSLVVYDSVIDAIKSAIELQEASKEWQIPVRVGIHIGDVVFRDKDIFGDAVNVASRIQTIGVPGSIVVSKKVADELKNQPNFSTVRLGQYSLKNVNEHLELFAIEGAGLVIPPLQTKTRKKSPTALIFLIAIAAFVAYAVLFNTGLLKPKNQKILEGRIAIPPFENFKLSPELNDIGDWAASYITADLKESSNADVVSYTSGLLYTNADMASMNRKPALARQTGAAIILKGSYSYSGSNKDSLVFWANLVDTRTMQILPATIPKIYCDADNPMKCIQEMSNRVKGFWKSKGEHVFRTPNNDAWIAYVNAQKIWANPDPAIQEQAKGFLLQAIGYDSLFLDAFFLLLDDFSNRDEFDNELDTIKLIKKRFKELNPRQENFLQYFEEELYGRNTEVFKHFMKEYPYDSTDLFLNTSGMVLAIEFLNDPVTALRFYKNVNTDSLDLVTCTYCRTTVNMAMQAYADTGDTINADKLAEKLKLFAKRSGQYTRLIAYYMSRKDTAAVNEVILLAAINSPTKDDQQYACFMAGRYAMLQGNLQLRDYYANKAILLYGKTTNRTLGRCYYLKGNLDEAEKIFISELKKKPSNYDLTVDLGSVYAIRGDHVKANEIITQLDGMKQEHDLGKTLYFQGRIKALLGENESAIQYLSSALNDGVTYRVGTTFQHDPDLIGLTKDPNYVSLLTRNRQK